MLNSNQSQYIKTRPNYHKTAKGSPPLFPRKLCPPQVTNKLTLKRASNKKILTDNHDKTIYESIKIGYILPPVWNIRMSLPLT